MDRDRQVTRLRLLSLTVIALVGMPTSRLLAQAQDLPKLDIGASGEHLRNGAMALRQGCDYYQYLQMADQMQSAFQSIKTMEQLRQGAAGDKQGFPFTDYIKLVMNAVSNKLQIDAAKSLRKGVLLEIEQLCTTMTMSDDMRRILELTRDGQVGIQELLPEASKLRARREAAAVDSSVKGVIDSAVYADARNIVPQLGAQTADSMVLTMIRNAERATAYARRALLAIDSVEANVERIADESFLFATKDSTGAWRCPPDYPAPRFAPELTRKPLPICGPPGTERAMQLIRALHEERMRLAIIDARTIPLLATMDAYTNLMVSHQRRVDHATLRKTTVR